MAIEDVIKESKQLAENESKRLGFGISSYALEEIETELTRNQENIEESLIKEVKTRSDIFESVRKLISQASDQAKKEERTTIYGSDIRSAMPQVCPLYWPFC